MRYFDSAKTINNRPWSIEHPDEIDLKEEQQQWDEDNNYFNLAKSLIRIKAEEIKLRNLIEELEKD